MDQKIQIDQIIFKAKQILMDVEDDSEWNYHDLLTLSIEWVSIILCIKDLIPTFEAQKMTESQTKEFALIKERFMKVNQKLKKLKLDNPFELA